MSNLQKLEQGRAANAYKCAEAVIVKYSETKTENEVETRVARKEAKKYKSHVKKMPMMIKTNGLGAAAAFAFSKSKGTDVTWALLLEHIEKWLIEKGDFVVGEKLHKKAIELESLKYRALTIEVFAFLNWLSRFAEGLIEGEDEGDN